MAEWDNLETDSAGPGHFISRGGGQQPAAGLIGAAWALLLSTIFTPHPIKPRDTINIGRVKCSSLSPPPCNPPPPLPEVLLTEVVAGARVVVLLEGGVQPGVDAHLKHGDGQI